LLIWFVTTGLYNTQSQHKRWTTD